MRWPFHIQLTASKEDPIMISGPLKALLRILAVAGYQNRDKIGELLRGLQT